MGYERLKSRIEATSYKSIFRYLTIGVFNFFVGYFSVILLYFLLVGVLEPFLIAVLGSCISIFVTVSGYHFLFFKNQDSYLVRIIRGYISYGLVSVLASMLFALLIERFGVWLAQGMTVVAAFFVSTVANFFFVFRAKR